MDAFLARVPAGLSVGAIALNGAPRLVVPPTSDHRLVRRAVGQLTAGGTTAIGDTLAAAVSVGKQATGQTRARAATRGASPGRFRDRVSILLLSDGAQTDGALRPLAGARRAQRAGIRVDTIALGTPTGTITLLGEGVVAVPPDPTTLAAIARLTGGRFTDATNASILRDAYTQLSTHFGRPSKQTEISYATLAAAATLLTAALAANALTTRLP